MPSIKDLKKRIGTVKNTQQTTKAMKMVSAAKLRRAQEAILSQRPYAKKLGEMIRLASQGSADDLASPLLVGRALPEGRKAKAMVVVVSSDRGLCGGFNGNIIKAAQKWFDANASKFETVEFCFVGKKINEIMKARKGIQVARFQEFGGKVVFSRAKELSAFLVDQYLTEKTDEIWVIYNEFKNAISQIIVTESFLPLNAQQKEVNQETTGKETVNPDLFIFKPERNALLEALLKKHFSVQIFRILLESQASEHGARMSAMENATKNAGEMIRKLTLLYNKQRQAGITKELLEIISGSESQKSA